eukprot:CAMPEP_0173198830 /NCGR_PEP_ID=MMETSP1141-20130122/16901_1 /TAXON_ID=483371 /ORGANISM="non described non described, Strain CCMP2298" /LENGTH=89 /DNA_ID=CAMNT_0014123659 /DNA_START=1546 /DNA_END=1815 /DNA_ORIENTATION=-
MPRVPGPVVPVLGPFMGTKSQGGTWEKEVGRPNEEARERGAAGGMPSSSWPVPSCTCPCPIPCPALGVIDPWLWEGLDPPYPPPASGAL